MMRFVCSSMIAILFASLLCADDAPIPVSNIAGKKLIRLSQSLSGHTQSTEVPGLVEAWQRTGYDGLCFGLQADVEGDDERKRMAWGWWDVDPRPRKRGEFDTDVKAFKSVKDWGRLTDDFIWMASHVAGHKPRSFEEVAVRVRQRGRQWTSRRRSCPAIATSSASCF